MIKYFKNSQETLMNINCKVNGIYDNVGVIVTDDEPNFSYINNMKKEINIVKEAYLKNPSSVKFYSNFVYVGDVCYNGIRREMIVKD